jgi:hypothetical protein
VGLFSKTAALRLPLVLVDAKMVADRLVWLHFERARPDPYM